MSTAIILIVAWLCLLLIPPTFGASTSLLAKPGLMPPGFLRGRTYPAEAIVSNRIYELTFSRAVLDQVITNLDLPAKWTPEFELPTLTPDSTYLLLKARLEVFHQPDADVYAITARSSNPEEAASIANEVAKALTVQIERDGAFKTIDDDSNQNGLEALAGEIRELKSNVRSLAKELNIDIEIAEPPNLSQDDPRFHFFKIRNELEHLRDRYTAAIASNVDAYITGRRSPSSTVGSRVREYWPLIDRVQMLSPAQPNQSPIDPPPILKLILLTLAAILGISSVFVFCHGAMRERKNRV